MIDKKMKVDCCWHGKNKNTAWLQSRNKAESRKVSNNCWNSLLRHICQIEHIDSAAGEVKEEQSLAMNSLPNP